jgi:hypothetical protein
MTSYTNIRCQTYYGSSPVFSANYGEVVLNCIHFIDPGTNAIKWVVTYATPYVEPAYAAPHSTVTVQPEPYQAQTVSSMIYYQTELYKEQNMNAAMRRFLQVKGLEEDFNRLFADEQVRKEMASAVKLTLDAQPLPEEALSGYAATGSSTK